jgi:Tol biopolymer transport system component
MSGDGRYIAYVSGATDLVSPNIGTPAGAVFLYDRRTGANTLVSRSVASETQASAAYNPVISHDGGSIAFESGATDLVPGQIDTNDAVDVFLYDREHGNTTLVSRSALSPVTTGNCSSFLPFPDARGIHIVFQSCATDLVPGVDDGNGTLDVFLFALDTGKTDLVSHSANNLASTGDDFSDQPVISGNGRYVAYRSWATNLVPGQIDSPYSFDVFLYDSESRQTALVSHTLGNPQQASNVDSEGPGLTPNGQYLVFDSSSGDLVERDFNGAYDVFLVRHPGQEDDDN